MTCGHTMGWNIYNQEEKSQMRDCCPSRESWVTKESFEEQVGQETSSEEGSSHECLRGDIPERTITSKGCVLSGWKCDAYERAKESKLRGKTGDGQVTLCVWARTEGLAAVRARCDRATWSEHGVSHLTAAELTRIPGDTPGPTCSHYTDTGTRITALRESQLRNLQPTQQVIDWWGPLP